MSGSEYNVEQACWLGNDITKEKRDRNWLRGALLAEAAGLLHILGVILLRRIALRKDSKQELHRQRRSWVCVILRLFAWVVSWCARCYAPDTTVAPIFLSIVLVANMASSPSVLHEQFYGREVLVTLGCVFAVWVSAANDLLVIWYSTREILVFDVSCLTEEIRKGMIICCSAWFFTSMLCLALLCKEKLKPGPNQKPIRENPRKKTGRCIPRHTRLAVLIPITLGLLEGAMHFVAYAGVPWCNLLMSEIDQGFGFKQVNRSFYPIVLIIAMLAVPAIYCEFEGAKNYDCRYFVPAYTAVSFTTGTILRALLKLTHVNNRRIPAMLAAQVLLIAGPFWISSISATIKLPRTLAKAEPLQPLPPTRQLPPLRNGYVEYLPLTATPLLEFEKGTSANTGVLDPEQAAPMLRLDPPKRKAYMWLFGKWAAAGRMVPLITLMIVPVLFSFLCWRGGPLDRKIHQMYCFLSLHMAFAVMGTALMNCIFSGIGRRRLQLCLESDYLVLCQDGQKRRAIKKRGYASGGRLVVVGDPYDTASSSSEEDDDLQWQMVRHFVIVEVDIADRIPEDLRCLLNSIAASPLAKEQIGVVLSRQETPEQPMGSPRSSSATPVTGKKRGERGIQRLEREFKNSFWRLMTIQNDAAGGSITGSKAAYLISDFVKTTQEVRAHLTLITHTTMDSVFHPQYFSALTFAFLASGKVRNTTIWQPPVFQLKDYYEQSAVTRHVSLLLAQEQLASLSDPLAVPLPKSTYSLPLNLVRAASGCWEPSFYLPDLEHSFGVWTKCWLTTIGRSSVQPIFLPVICNAMPRAGADAGESSGNGNPCGSQRNGTSSSSSGSQIGQVQVYARGLLELSYFWGALPLALLGRRGSRSVHLGRLLCLVGRSVPPVCRMAWSHIVRSTIFLSVLVNVGWMLTKCFKMQPQPMVYTSLVLVCLSALFYGVSLLPVIQIMANAGLMRDLVQIIPPPDGVNPHGLCHALRLGLEGLYASPFFHIVVAIEEWYAALQICTFGCMRSNAREWRQDGKDPPSPTEPSLHSVVEPPVAPSRSRKFSNGPGDSLSERSFLSDRGRQADTSDTFYGPF